MLELDCYRLYFHSSLHVGRKGIGEESVDETIRSDTLFSALIWAYSMLEGREKVLEIIKKAKNGMPEFVISSTFPFAEEELYFPVPANIRTKEKKFLRKGDFERAIRGELEKEDKVELKFFKQSEINRNVQSRITGKTDIFSVGEMIFREECGLYFLAKGADLLKILRYLGEEGIGGYRSVGKGRFEVKKEKISIDTSNEREFFLTMSLFLPKKEEIQLLKHPESRYLFENRTGWSNIPGMKPRKISLRMISEGSVLPMRDRIHGYLWSADENKHLESAENVIRYGFAFQIPVVMKK